MTPDLPDGGRGGWNDELDEVLAGDLTAGLAYVTPAAGAVVTAIAPVGLRDREAGTVGFTTSLGFGRKLERIARDPHVALAYHARDHGKSGSSRFVLVQGHASARAPDPAMLAALGPQIAAHLGPPRQGKLFWDRWLREYYGDRVLVDVVVRRILSWPTLDCAGAPEVHGEPLLDAPPPSQREPAKGTGPRVSAAHEAARVARLPHRLLATVQADGFPSVLPFTVEGADTQGLRLYVPGGVPPGGRRAGLLAHSYHPKLIGLAARQYTGWLTGGQDATHACYAPHTATGFHAPPNKTLLLLANGYMARRGLRRAQRARRAAAAGAGALGAG